jgi:amidophosphoribosyltransferase
MSELIKHECGVALVRLLRPLSYYKETYGTALYGMDRLRLLIQKQRNRGQDGAGVATVKLDMPPGKQYIDRIRTNGPNYLNDIFDHIYSGFLKGTPEQRDSTSWMKDNAPFLGELLLGHLRYGTHGLNAKENCHPFHRRNNWMSRNLLLAGNFNLTNVGELFDELTELGQFPVEKTDTVTMLEKIGHFLDDEVERIHTWYKPDGLSNREINEKIAAELNIQRLLTRASREFDGGYVMAGLIGHGDAFVMRDPNGIRPAFYYYDDEVAVVASERPAIQTTFDVHISQVRELKEGHVLIIKKDGRISEVPFTTPKTRHACSFERVYFSRGSDRDIYIERKRLGENLVNQVLEAIDYDFDNTIFSFIPNTAETAFLGLLKGIEKRLNKIKEEQISRLDNLNKEALSAILHQTVRVEKLVVKDEKLRTFIADNDVRGDLVSHVYDITYGIVRNEVDTLVLLDDSIVRGTTFRNSILKIVARLRPKRIILVSSAPQIRYPDCYGIDMAIIHKLVAFNALIALLEEKGKSYLLEEVYDRCKAQEHSPKEQVTNEIKVLYDQFTYEEISDKIAEIITPKDITPEVKLIFQTLEGLRSACPNNNGDWYFSGDYPTPGGYKVVNQSFINYMEHNEVRAY